jgi:hypothetical protein
MQNITISYNGQELILQPVPVIIENDVNWLIAPIPPQQPPLQQPYLFSISIIYLDNNNDLKILQEFVVNNNTITTNLNTISNQDIKVSILLYFDSNRNLIQEDVDVIIRRDNIQN